MAKTNTRPVDQREFTITLRIGDNGPSVVSAMERGEAGNKAEAVTPLGGMLGVRETLQLAGLMIRKFYATKQRALMLEQRAAEVEQRRRERKAAAAPPPRMIAAPMAEINGPLVPPQDENFAIVQKMVEEREKQRTGEHAPGTVTERAPVQGQVVVEMDFTPSSTEAELITPKYPHKYPGCEAMEASEKVEDFYTSDCEYGCDCWMGASRSGGPDGIDPHGDCPNHPDLERAGVHGSGSEASGNEGAGTDTAAEVGTNAKRRRKKVTETVGQ